MSRADLERRLDRMELMLQQILKQLSAGAQVTTTVDLVAYKQAINQCRLGNRKALQNYLKNGGGVPRG